MEGADNAEDTLLLQVSQSPVWPLDADGVGLPDWSNSGIGRGARCRRRRRRVRSHTKRGRTCALVEQQPTYALWEILLKRRCALSPQVMMMDSMWLDGHQQAKLDSARPLPSNPAERVRVFEVETDTSKLARHSGGAAETEDFRRGSSLPVGCEGVDRIIQGKGNSGGSATPKHQSMNQQPRPRRVNSSLSMAKYIAKKQYVTEMKTASGDSEVFGKIVKDPLQPSNGSERSLLSQSDTFDWIKGSSGGGIGFSSSCGSLLDGSTDSTHDRAKAQFHRQHSLDRNLVSRQSSGASCAPVSRDSSGLSDLGNRLSSGHTTASINKLCHDLAMGAADITAGGAADAPAIEDDVSGISGIEFIRGTKSLTAAATLSLIMRTSPSASNAPAESQASPATLSASRGTGPFAQPAGADVQEEWRRPDETIPKDKDGDGCSPLPPPRPPLNRATAHSAHVGDWPSPA